MRTKIHEYKRSVYVDSNAYTCMRACVHTHTGITFKSNNKNHEYGNVDAYKLIKLFKVSVTNDTYCN